MNITFNAIWKGKEQAYFPLHPFVNNCIFSITHQNEYGAEKEAHFADAFARLAEVNGLNKNEVQQLFPAVMRMLKSKSEWAK